MQSVKQRVLGLDIGMKADYSALVSLNYVNNKAMIDYTYRWSLGTKLLSVASNMHEVILKLNPAYLLIDATMNHSVFEEIKLKEPRCRVIPITITGGNVFRVNRFGGYNVSKSSLITTLMTIIERRLIAIPRNSTTLIKELSNFKRHISKAGNAKYEAPQGEHDDLVMAMSLCVWWKYSRYDYTNKNDGGGITYDDELDKEYYKQMEEVVDYREDNLI
jgi:hypothetical protein